MHYDYHTAENIRIGGIVKQFRLAAGLSRPELGRRVGSSYDLIGAIERGKRNCTPTMRRNIVDAIGVPLSIFTKDDVRREHLARLEDGVKPLETSAA